MAVITRLPVNRPRRTSFTDGIWERRASIARLLPPSLPRLPEPVRVPGISRDIEIEIASTRSAWEGAFELVEQNYEAHGYERPGAGSYRFTPYHALPTTAVLVAREHRRVVATLSVIMDTTLLGLPSEAIYAGEVEQLRRRGRRLCEVGNLADRQLPHREFLPVFVALTRLAWQFSLRQGADTALISSTPRHALFYQRVMGFAPLGPSRPYPYVQDAQAQACWLDVPRMKATAPDMHRQLLGTPLPPESLRPRRLPTDLALHFAARSSRTCRTTVERTLQAVEQCGNSRRW